MNLFKKKETHYVLVGHLKLGERTSVGPYGAVPNELHQFDCKEEAQLWVQGRIRDGSGYTYRVLEQIELWEARTVYDNVLDKDTT